MYAKYYENPTMLSRVTAKNVGDVFFETHCTIEVFYLSTVTEHTQIVHKHSYKNTICLALVN